jgi:hypothetical protein
LNQLKNKIHLLILLTSLFVCPIIANFIALGDSLLAYGNPVVTPYLWVTPTTYIATEQSETFVIDINVSNVDNLRAFEFKLSYNTTLLNVVQVAQGSFFPSPPSISISKLEADETAGLVCVSISLANSESPKSGSGSLATVTFRVTFAPSSLSRICCVLDLYDTVLYDCNMAPIVHDSVDGLYFWRTLLDDPPAAGLLLDLTTQKGGVGQNATDGTFALGEIVELTAHLTFNNEPIQQKMVAFEVRNPNNEVVINRVVLTNENGYAIASFQIPSLLESVGTWTVVASASVSDSIVWDWLTFTVQAPPVGGQMKLVQKDHVPILYMDAYFAILVAIVFLAAMISKTSRVFNCNPKF